MIIEATNITKLYRNTQALNRVSFNIASGEAIGIIGHNGSGKTTLLKIIAGTIFPTSGHIRFPEDEIKVASIFEDHRFLDHLSGWENIVASSNFDVDLQRLAELFKKFGLFEKRNSKYKTFSTGMKRRLDIIFLFLYGSDLIVLDEPTNGLDIDTTGLFLQSLETLKESGVSIIISSHNTLDLEKICDTLLIMKKGQILDRVNLKALNKGDLNIEQFYITQTVNN